MIFFADDESKEEGELVSSTSFHHQNQHNRGPAILTRAEVSEEHVVAEESVATEEPRAMEETERVKIDDPYQLKIASTSLMILGERVEMQLGLPNIMMPALKILKCSLTTGPIGGNSNY